MKTYQSKEVIEKRIYDETSIKYSNILNYLDDIKINITDIDLINYVNELYYNKSLDKRKYCNMLRIGLNERKYYKKYLDIVINKTRIYCNVLYFLYSDDNNIKDKSIFKLLDIKCDKNNCIRYDDINRLVNIIISNLNKVIHLNACYINNISSYFSINSYLKNFNVNFSVYPTNNLININPYIHDDTSIDVSENTKKLQRIKAFSNFIKN